MTTHRFLLVVLLGFATSFAAAQSTNPPTPAPGATSPAGKGPAKTYNLKFCLVTDSDLDSMGEEVSIVYQGREIKFCCKPCEKKFLRNPQKYLAKLAAEEGAKK